MLTLEGRIVIVTGGSRGIGKEIARCLAENRMKVAILSRNTTTSKLVANELCNDGFCCKWYQCDLTNAESVKYAIYKVAESFGGIDVLVNNAGILDMTNIEDETIEEWNNVISTNLTGTFLMIQHSLPYLKKSRAARIINISSNSGRMGGFENGMAYTASKGGIIALTYGVARRLASFGITVNCIAPGTIQTDMVKQRDEETIRRLQVRFPVGRFGNPQDVAAAVCYFASEESSFTTGAVLDVNGGLFMG